jgi:hypothetical protein
MLSIVIGRISFYVARLPLFFTFYGAAKMRGVTDSEKGDTYQGRDFH